MDNLEISRNIYAAIMHADFKLADVLLDKCTDLYYKENNYLLESARHPHCPISVFEKLIRLGCDVNEENQNSFTPIFNVAYHGDVDKIKFFIKKGSDLKHLNRFKVNVVSNCVCSPTFNIDALIILLENDADYLTIDRDGESFVDSARSANMPQALLRVFEKAFKQEINRVQFIEQLKLIRNLNKNTSFTNYSIEKQYLNGYKQYIFNMAIPVKPLERDGTEFSEIYVLAMSRNIKEALNRGLLMMQKHRFSIMLLFMLTCCFNEIGENELFKEYKTLFFEASGKISKEKKMGILAIENQIGIDAFYRVNSFEALFTYIF